MLVTLTLEPAILNTFHHQLDWARGRCLAVARGTGRTRELADDLADDLLSEVTEAFLATPEWFAGPTRCGEARVRHRLVLLIRQRATAFYRSHARARTRLSLTERLINPADAVDEALSRRTLVAEAPRWVRDALDRHPGRRLAVLAVDLPLHATFEDFCAAPPVRGPEEAWALLQELTEARWERPGWKALIAEILRGTGPVGTTPSRDLQRLVNGLEHTLSRAYADIAVHVGQRRLF